MKEHECSIGLLDRCGIPDLVTLAELEEHIKSRINTNNELKKNFPNIARKLLYEEWHLKDYADRRKSTNLERFDFCPRCGKKIDWNKMRNGGISDGLRKKDY